MHLNGFDFVIIVILALSTLLGLARGFILELICLIPWIAAIALALIFSNILSAKFSDGGAQSTLIHLAAFLVIFIPGYMLAALGTHFIKSSVKDGSLSRSGSNKVLGMVYGFIRGLLLILLILMIAKATKLNQAGWYQKSQLAPYGGGFINIVTPIINNNSNPTMIKIAQCIIT